MKQRQSDCFSAQAENCFINESTRVQISNNGHKSGPEKRRLLISNINIYFGLHDKILMTPLCTGAMVRHFSAPVNKPECIDRPNHRVQRFDST